MKREGITKRQLIHETRRAAVTKIPALLAGLYWLHRSHATYFVGMGWLVFKLTGSALYLGLLGVAMAAPTILATLAGGLVADHGNRGRILLITSILAGLALGILTILDLGEWVTVWQVLLLAALLGLISGFDLPARVSFFPALIEPHQMMSAVALNSILWQGTRMVLPAVGGVLIALADTWIIFALCTVGFAVMARILLSLQTPNSLPERLRPQSWPWRSLAIHPPGETLRCPDRDDVDLDVLWHGLCPDHAGVCGITGHWRGRAMGCFSLPPALDLCWGPFWWAGCRTLPKLGGVMMGGSVLFCLSLILFALVTGLAADWRFAFALACACVMLSAVGDHFSDQLYDGDAACRTGCLARQESWGYTASPSA